MQLAEAYKVQEKLEAEREAIQLSLNLVSSFILKLEGKEEGEEFFNITQDSI
jgi:hypothetical protein